MVLALRSIEQDKLADRIKDQYGEPDHCGGLISVMRLISVM